MQMKKAVVIGGSNGMGLAIAKQLIKRGYYLEICDRIAPEEGILKKQQYYYNYCDLSDFDDEVFTNLEADEDVELLMITAGIGRIADFQYHHIAEIEKMLTIDAVSTLKIFRIFYDRILKDKVFYAGVMGSISGWMSSPSASVYAAAKAAVVRFVESVNIELEAYGSNNRILDVSPASFKGSRFYGGKNNLLAMQPLAEEIITHLFQKDTLFIPQYNEIFKDVLARYHKDPHEYGLHSYHYKAESGRLDNHQRVKIGYLSGKFETLNLKIVQLLQKEKQKCDYLIVGIFEGDNLDERKQLVASCKYVDKVVDADDRYADLIKKEDK